MKDRIRVIVVDDAKVDRLVLKNLISSHEVLCLVGEANSAAEAAPLIEAEEPNAIFLDVHMPGGDGFQMLQALKQPTKVVFVTASPRHAVLAFDLEAVDYLLKPVSPTRFEATVERLRRSVLETRAEPVRYERNDRICLRTQGQAHILPVRDVMALIAEGDSTKVLAAGVEEPILVGQRLGEFEELLPAGMFRRIDRSTLINLKGVLRLESKGLNAAELWLSGLHQPLKLGRTAKQRLRGEMKTFLS